MSKQITVISQIMGSGKTTNIFKFINSNPDKRYIFVTPFLSEIIRIQKNCVGFVTPEKLEGTKLNHLLELIDAGENIATTHSLFQYLNDGVKAMLKGKDYVFILDECLDIISPIPMTTDDIRMLLKYECIEILEDSLVVALKDDYNGKFNYELRCIKNHHVELVDDTMMLCLFKPDLWNCFEQTYILTYRFKNSLMDNYFSLYNIDYTVAHFRDGQIVSGLHDDSKIRTNLKLLINVYDGKLNDIGEKSLSTHWYQETKNKKHIDTISKNTYNYFYNIIGCKSNDALWSSVGGEDNKTKKRVAPRDYKRSFLPLNSRATNAYRKRTTLAYLCNLYVNPYIVKFFSRNNIAVRQDEFALSIMLQWLWRSAIRENNPINVYIPSERMRNLLIKFLDNKI